MADKEDSMDIVENEQQILTRQRAHQQMLAHQQLLQQRALQQQQQQQHPSSQNSGAPSQQASGPEAPTVDVHRLAIEIARILNPILTSAGGSQTGGQQPPNSTPSRPNMSVGWDKVRSMSKLISEFGGGEDEYVDKWLKRIEHLAAMYNADQGVVMLAAISQLEIGTMLRSWVM